MKRGELDDLVAYATIARARSFTRAAAELGVSPSVLSHTVKGLESRLGVRLLARTTRSVVPTPAGERLLRSIESAVEEVETGLSAISEWRGDPSGTIRITTSQFAARTVMAPALPKFLLENPKISVEVSVDSRLADLVRDGFDAEIRWEIMLPRTWSPSAWARPHASSSSDLQRILNEIHGRKRRPIWIDTTASPIASSPAADLFPGSLSVTAKKSAFALTANSSSTTRI